MRKYAILREAVRMDNDDSDSDLLVKVMIHTIDNDGTFLYLFTTLDEYCGASNDYWFENLEDAEECALDYGVRPEDWILIDDPLPHCQHDLIHPIRIKGRETGIPMWGETEIFDGDKWVDFDYEKLKAK